MKKMKCFVIASDFKADKCGTYIQTGPLPLESGKETETVWVSCFIWEVEETTTTVLDLLLMGSYVYYLFVLFDDETEADSQSGFPFTVLALTIPAPALILPWNKTLVQFVSKRDAVTFQE